MTQSERLVYLLRALLAEEAQWQGVEIPESEAERKQLLRALMNVRPPRPIGEDFLAVQDAWLAQERDALGVTDGDALPPLACDRRLVLWRGDITTLRVDAIVNAANSALLGCFHPLHSCIDNVIHSKSGIQLRLYCDALMREQGHEEPTGRAKLTPAFNLPCRYVLHTVGPIVEERVTPRERTALASCYRACLSLAAEAGCRSIALCCISTGVFRFPNEEAAAIAVETVREFLRGDARLARVIFNVFTDRDLAVYRALLGETAPEGEKTNV